jgi:hypothetical protein
VAALAVVRVGRAAIVVQVAAAVARAAMIATATPVLKSALKAN